jgi:hypothetical protein
VKLHIANTVSSISTAFAGHSSHGLFRGYDAEARHGQAINYGQNGFEGLKAFRASDGTVRIFRPDENARRLQRTADIACMPSVPVEVFVPLASHSPRQISRVFDCGWKY